jgi:hypothetical protein
MEQTVAEWPAIRFVDRAAWALSAPSFHLGEFSLSSDSIAHTYRYVKATAPIIQAVPHEEMESFYSLACTVGGYIVFPAKKIEGKATINGARGLNWKIRDRIDADRLTLRAVDGSNTFIACTPDRSTTRMRNNMLIFLDHFWPFKPNLY